MDCSSDEATAESALECTLVGGVFDYGNCACQNYCTGQAAIDCREEGKMLTPYPECACVDIPSSASSLGSSDLSTSSEESSSSSSEESSSSDPCTKHKCYNGCSAVQTANGKCVCDCDGAGCEHPYSSGCSAGGDGWYYGGTRCNVVTACPGSLSFGDTPQPGTDPYPDGWTEDSPYTRV